MGKYLDALENVIETHYDKHDKDTELVRKGLKALEVIKETWGDSILCDIEKGFILGCPYTKLPNKEDYDLLKEVLI